MNSSILSQPQAPPGQATVKRESPEELQERIENAQELVQKALTTTRPAEVDREWSHRQSQVKSKRVMIVDDEETNIMMVHQYLSREGYENFVTCSDPREAIQLAETKRPDVILLDVNMPHLNGIQLLKLLNLDMGLRNIPVLVLTAATDPETKSAALELGASDFLNKPVDPRDLLPRVRNSLMLKLHFDEMALQKDQLEQLVMKRTQELYESRQQIILTLGRAAEHRDNETGYHVLRVGHFAGLIAKQLGWSTAAVSMIQQAAQLHDVGKIGIPDSVLFKPGKLDPDEYELMRQHCALGRNIISPMNPTDTSAYRTHTKVGASILHTQNSPLMIMAARIAQSHHERWDGTGYPMGLAGKDIPIESRITAVADVFDALSSKRPYKDPYPRAKCFEILKKSRGSHFDPAVLDAFFACSKEIIEVQMAFMDS